MLEWLPGYVFVRRRELLLLSTITLLMIALLTVPRAVYIRTYLQDTFSQLDGIHRMILGQVPHRDFSSILGIIFYGLPALFVHAGADPLNSISYATCVLLIINYFILWHLMATRLQGSAGLLFGIWTVLALTARMNFGQNPEFVTLAMSYNRIGDVFLCEFLIFFIPPVGKSGRIAALDAVCMSVITVFLFYTKITFGLCALTAAPLLAIYRWHDAGRVAAEVALFLIVGVVLELTFHFHKAYLEDILMAIQSSVRTSRVSSIYEIVVNLPEITACLVLPAILLIWNRMMTLRVLLLFLFVGLTSFLLLNQSAQVYIMSLPFALLFITLHLLGEGEKQAADPARRIRFVLTSQVMQGIILVVWFLYSCPLAVNVGVSFAKALDSPVAMPGMGLLGEMHIEGHGEDALETLNLPYEGLPPLEIFERAINSRQLFNPDRLNESEYVASLADGIRALQDACSLSPRILTADSINPFPAVLNLPVGGGMTTIHPDLLVSEQSHIAPERMFADIDCVMVPKLPVQLLARAFVLSVYGDYLKQNFETVKQTDYWTVLRRKTS
jgi:hypothetical protein